ncbi:MAG TPA: EAL domain-containing protein [Steroidobacteraceae bacterium]|nr:EAL domain-containing protein [Steroidobacteraceae bacterium]
MSEQNAVPLIVLSPTQDSVEVVNASLRRAGHAVHCTWIPALGDLGDALTQLNPELLVVAETGGDLAGVAAVRDQLAPTVPIVVLEEEPVDEARIASAMQHGARDLVSLANASRLQAVLTRELRSHRLERALEGTLRTARDTRQQLASVLERSNDAIAQVQEGILVDANHSWLELFGYELQGIAGQPVMDLFEESTHAALKGALAACLQGRWSGDHPLNANARFSDGSHRPIDLLLALGEHDGEPCVQLILASRRQEARPIEQDLADAVNRDPSTAMLYRPPLLKAVAEKLATPARGGVRCFAVVRPDRFPAVERELGLEGSEQALAGLAEQLREGLHPSEIAGRLGGTAFLVLLERGNERDVDAWGAQLTARVSRHVVGTGGKSLNLTCSVGLAAAPASGSPNATAEAAIAEALDACRRARQRGGNQVAATDRSNTDERVQAYDSVWVKHIKAALVENRFRLVQQPVASLQGENTSMFDVLVRMLDRNEKEVLPGEFMPAAERNDLLRAIDRWVIGASLAFAAQKQPACLFVRLSRDTLRDATLLTWLDGQLRSSRAEAKRLCFQAPEEVVASQIGEVQALTVELRKRGFRFAIDRFGSGRDPQSLLKLPLSFIKIDGALVQGLTSNAELHQRVRTLAETAAKRQIESIAERVEDANTMAVLWQLGVHYIQGYFVNAPEQVVIG